MTDVMTDDSASAEPAETLEPEIVDQAEPDEGDQDIGDDNPDDQPDSEEEEDDGLVDWSDDSGKTYRVPPQVKDGLMMKADYTRKTMELADSRKAIEAREAQAARLSESQAAFTQEIAQLGALQARLQPFEQVADWPTYLRQAAMQGPEMGARAQADYAEFQALQRQHDQFAYQLSQRVQQRAADAQREDAKLIETGRAELAKAIKGYSPATLDKLTAFAEPFGYSSEEIRQAEADPRAIRVLHLAMTGHEALQQQKKTSTIAQGQKTKPVQTLNRGSGGRIQARPDTDDFAAFERLSDERLKARQ
jgi:hypothetical protein